MSVPSASTWRTLSLAAGLAASLAFTLPAAHAAAAAAATATASTGAVAWLPAAGDADIERAFAQARSERKPVLLYWGAKWCPPCNQLTATLFNRQDFITQSRAIVAVGIDGDLPGAQKLGARFKVRGYPTMILFSPEGAELTRLPGEVDAPKVMQVLQLGLAGGRPIKAVLADARAGKPQSDKLSANEWRLLAFYSWETDEQQLVQQAELPGLLAGLAAASPPADSETTTRLWLKALAANGSGKALKPDAALRERVQKVLADPKAAREQMDVLTYGVADIARSLAAGNTAVERSALLAAYDAALRRFEADASLSRADRMSATIARVDLARLDLPPKELHPKLAAPLLSDVRELVARADREITDGYERQAVITSAAYLLGRAGLWTESDALLKSSLAKSHSPYYLMSQLGGNARKLGKKDEALRWYEQAFAKSEGPATRLQWGASYLTALVELAPQDAARIERTAQQLIREAGGQSGAFYERSGRSLQKVGSSLAGWNADGRNSAAIKRLQGKLDAVCGKLEAADPQRATCESLLKQPAKAGA